MPPVTLRLIGANVAVFFLQMLAPAIVTPFALWPLAASGAGYGVGFEPWQLEHLSGTAAAITGPFGRARLVRTPLFSLLVLEGGRIAAGAVTSDRLVAALAEAGMSR